MTGGGSSPVVREVIGKLADVPPGTKKSFTVREKTILVINDNGKLHAVNGLCSHYNFPLEQGVYYKGKIRCPLHGACFNVCTGDIEDYPGFDSIHAYKIEADSNGDLIFTATEDTLKDRRTKIVDVNSCSDLPIIVVGSGPAASSFIESVRQNGYRGPITVVTEESLTPYDRVLLSKVPGIPAENVVLRNEEFYKKHKIDFELNTKVVSLNPVARSVTLSNGCVLRYTKLVIATGCHVRKLSIPGADLKNVFYLRKHEDANAIAAASAGRHVVCIGGSFIGLEVAAALSGSAGSVTIISSTKEPLPAFDEDVGAEIRRRFEAKGVKFHLGTTPTEIIGTDTVQGVILSDGTMIIADVVVAGIGVLPSTDFLKGSGIALDKRGFILVDKHFRTNGDWIYAIGDVTAAPLPQWDFENLNIQHFQTAQTHGNHLGYGIVGKPHPRPNIPFFWCVFFLEFGVRFTGNATGHDEVITRGDVSALQFSKYYLKNNVVVAVANAGFPATAIVFCDLFRLDIPVTKKDIENTPEDRWEAFLAANGH